MKKNKGITMVALVITIVILLIIAGISIGTGNNIIKQTEIENIKTNMLLIKVKGLEYAENANFKLGTNIDTIKEGEEKSNRIQKAKAELKGEEIVDANQLSNKIGITQENLVEENATYIYYYKLTSENLTEMGIANVKSDDKNGLYIIRYDIKNAQVEIYNLKGIENEGKTYYSLSEINKI